MKILLKGYYGFGNLGDDILMLVSYRLLKKKYPEADIAVFSNNTANNPDAHYPPGYNNYIKSILKENIKLVDWTYTGHFDLIFHGGGGIYFDNTSSWLSMMINLFIKKLPIRATTYIDNNLRKLKRKPHNLYPKRRVGMGIGIGKYKQGATQLFYDLAEIGTYNKLIVRDSFSFNFLKKRKMPIGNYAQNTDLAFLNSWNTRGFKIRNQIFKIGIIIKDKLSEGLQKTLFDFYKKKKNEGYKVTFLSFDKHFDTEIKARCDGYNYLAYNPMELDFFLEQLDQQDLLISSRAHGVIMGACLGIPSIVLNTEIKLKEVANMFPKGCLRLDEWNYTFLHNEFEKLKINYNSITSQLQDEVLRNQKLAKQLAKQF